MKRKLIALTVFFTITILPALVFGADLSGCTLKGIPLYGRVKVVRSFPDFKIKIVSHDPDLKVKLVNSMPESCGQWQFVDSAPDFTVQFVNAFEDFTVQYVEIFPGVMK